MRYNIHILNRPDALRERRDVTASLIRTSLAVAVSAAMATCMLPGVALANNEPATIEASQAEATSVEMGSRTHVSIAEGSCTGCSPSIFSFCIRNFP